MSSIKMLSLPLAVIMATTFGSGKRVLCIDSSSKRACIRKRWDYCPEGTVPIYVSVNLDDNLLKYVLESDSRKDEVSVEVLKVVTDAVLEDMSMFRRVLKMFFKARRGELSDPVAIATVRDLVNMCLSEDEYICTLFPIKEGGRVRIVVINIARSNLAQLIARIEMLVGIRRAPPSSRMFASCRKVLINLDSSRTVYYILEKLERAGTARRIIPRLYIIEDTAVEHVRDLVKSGRAVLGELCLEDFKVFER